jgi:hypothetical protein
MPAALALLYVKTEGRSLRPGMVALRFTDGIAYRYGIPVYVLIGSQSIQFSQVRCTDPTFSRESPAGGGENDY